MRAGVLEGPDALVRYSPPFFGLLFAALLKNHRRAVRRNIRRALKDAGPLDEAAGVAQVFTNFASCLTEAFLIGSGRGERLNARCVNHDLFERCAKRGRGVILATAHTGGWQVAGPVLSSVYSADVLVVMQRERDGRAQALQDDARDRAGIRIAHVGGSPLDSLPLLAHLRRGGVLAVQVDRVPRGMRGHDVELFGEPFKIPEGPLVLAALSGAPILPVFTRRLGFMEYEVLLGEAIELPRKPSPEVLDRAARHLAGEMERFVRANPTQWFHFE
ncbi:MAG: lysophospholipid acyltransferase family protein [Polyangiaceae bacterium]|nr:lysophospholipid acyltransferase family protein [Polyangiaceae bacterium]